MALQKNDLEMGKLNEETSIIHLNKYLNTELMKDDNKYGIIDFYNKEKTIYVELKSRRINHNKYSTALCGLNKIKELIKLNCDAYIAFKYEDGLFIIKYDKKLFKTFDIQKNYQRSFRNDVGKVEQMDVIHIPYKYLIKIN